jgi:oligoribonuclease
MKKAVKVNRFIWIDCEMTGLEIQKDVLLEIATIITDVDLNIIAEGPELVIHQSDKHLDAMIPLVRDMHKKSGLTEDVRSSAVSLDEAEKQTFEFIQKHCKKEAGVLAGNTVWQDALFLRKYMPRITNFLNYRIVDVSSVKVLVNQWYPKDPYTKFEKAKTHRALADIRESIAELRHYRKYFFRVDSVMMKES